jgi:long-chain acyl-CoA synthetase
MSSSNSSNIFSESQFFFDLLLKCSVQVNDVLARTYVNGSWVQFTGRDFSAHLGRAVEYWLELFNLEKIVSGQTVILLTRNTYNSFISSLAAIMCGLDVMFAPLQMSKTDISWCLNYFNGVAIATDMEELTKHLDGFSVPIINIATAAWMPQDKHEEPDLLKVYRLSKLALASSLEEKKENDAISSEWFSVKPGRFSFVSFGHDGFQQPETLPLDALVVVAQNFLIHAEIPKNIYWKSMELMVPSNPFVHISKICVMLRNGIIGFPNPVTDWETNLRILRPTFLFASSPELQQICNFIDDVSNRKMIDHRFNLSEKIDTLNKYLTSSKVKIPENTFNFVKRTLRFGARSLAGKHFIKDAVEDLRFIVHGLAPAQESQVISLEKLGIPVLETYGTTQSAGILSSNNFHSPNLNTIGTPLPHVSFRLGQQSILEYRISISLFRNAGKWQETGDVAQMTSYGFIITGRKRHLFVTLGGVLVSPARLEQSLKEDDLIADACVIGDKLPYLSALIILKQDAFSDYQLKPNVIMEHVQAVISKVNESLPRNVTIKKFVILEKPFTEVNGERLSNGEINRMKIQETCSDVIASLY